MQETSRILEQRNLDPLCRLGQPDPDGAIHMLSTAEENKHIQSDDRITSAVQRCFIQISRRSRDAEYTKA